MRERERGSAFVREQKKKSKSPFRENPVKKNSVTRTAAPATEESSKIKKKLTRQRLKDSRI